MTDMKACIANCIIGGEYYAHYDDGQVRNKILLKLGRYNIEIIQKPDFILKPSNKFENVFNHTTDITVYNIKETEFSQIKRVIQDLCYLLSLATISQVRPFKYECGTRGETYSVTGITLFSRQIIKAYDGRVVREFLEKTWISYRKIKARRKLAAIIDYIVTAELPLQPLEVKLLLIFTAMESLKATYAKEKRIPFIPSLPHA